MFGDRNLGAFVRCGGLQLPVGPVGAFQCFRPGSDVVVGSVARSWIFLGRQIEARTALDQAGAFYRFSGVDSVGAGKLDLLCERVGQALGGAFIPVLVHERNLGMHPTGKLAPGFIAAHVNNPCNVVPLL